MKRTMLQMTLVVGLAACSVCFAQAQNVGLYKTEIPFDFTVGKKQYAAGPYSIEVRGFEQKFFVLRDAEGRNGYLIKTRPGTQTRQLGALLDFHRIGDQYVLALIRTSGLDSDLPKVPIEGSLARNGAERKVTVALSQEK